MELTMALEREINSSRVALTQQTIDRLTQAGKLTAEVPQLPLPEHANGQNFLIDPKIIAVMSDCVKPASTVFEVGPGVGALTDALIERANRYVGIELDQAFSPVLHQTIRRDKQRHPGFVLGDALTFSRIFGLDKLAEEKTPIQVVSNLPFGIAKEFMAQLADAPIDSAVFFLGNRLAKEVKTTDTKNPRYGHISLIAQTFFNIVTVASVDIGCFYPLPTTTGEVVVMTPKPRDEIDADPLSHVFAEIIRDTKNSVGRPSEMRRAYSPPTVLKSILNAGVKRDDITALEIETLQKPFFGMSRADVRHLVQKLPKGIKQQSK